MISEVDINVFDSDNLFCFLDYLKFEAIKPEIDVLNTERINSESEK